MKYSPTGEFFLNSDILGFPAMDWGWLNENTAIGYRYDLIPNGLYTFYFPDGSIKFLGDYNSANRLRFFSSNNEWLVDLTTGPIDNRGAKWDASMFAARGLGNRGERLFICKPDYQKIYIDDGSFYNASNYLDDSFTMKNGRLMWHSTNGPRDIDGNIVGPPGSMQTFSGDWCCGYVVNQGLCLWKWGSTIGYVLSSDGKDYYPDLFIEEDGWIKIGSTETQGDTGAREYIFNAISKELIINSEIKNLEEIDLLKSPEPVFILPDIIDTSYPCYVGSSWVPKGEEAPGNCQFLTEMAGEPVQSWNEMKDAKRDIFASEDTIALDQRLIQNRPNPLPEDWPPFLLGQLGTIEGGGSDYDYKNSILFKTYLDLCRSNNTRAIPGDDGNSGPYPKSILDLLSNWDIPTAELYPVHGETTEETLIRLDIKVNLLYAQWKYDFGIIIPFYTQQGNWLKETILAIHSRINQWSISSNDRLKVFWLFPRKRLGIGGPNEDTDMLEMNNRVCKALSIKGKPILRLVGNSTPIEQNPKSEPEPEPTQEELAMQLPAQCFALLHNGNIATAIPGASPILDLNHTPQEFGSYQKIEVKKSETDPSKVLVRFLDADRLFRVDRVLAEQGKFDLAVGLWDPKDPTADSSWQEGIPVGPYILYGTDSPDGNRHGIGYVLTCVDESGKLFR